MSNKKRGTPHARDRVVIYSRRYVQIGKNRRETREWRWKRIAPNGKIVGASTESYRRKIDAKNNFARQFFPCSVEEREWPDVN